MNLEMEQIAAAIRNTVARREDLLQAMASWYAEDRPGRFPDYPALAALEQRLSDLDTHYKLLWDAAGRDSAP